MKIEISRAADCAEYDTDERCAILEIANDPSDPEVSIARARVAPGVTTAWHRLVDTQERYIILTGKGRVELADRPAADVGPGDVVLIPAGVAQRIENTADTDLLFYAICSPRFRPECYIAME